MDSIRVANIGNGGIYRIAHGPAWPRVPKAIVVANCDVDLASAQRAGDALGGTPVFDNVDELFASAEFDLVDICTPHDSHAELSVRALRAGKHVICEKPMTMNLDDAARLIDTANQSDRQLFVAHNRRFDRRWIEVKQQIESGRIGEPVAARWSERSWAGFPADSWRWLSSNGGVLMDLGVHVADLFAWFFDEHAHTAYAKTKFVRPEALENHTADFAVVQLTYPGNRQALMELSWAHPASHAPFYSALEVIGTEGKIRLSDQDSAPMLVLRDAIEVPRYSTLLSTFPDAFVDELSHFVDCAMANKGARITMQDAFHATAAMVGALASAESGKPERISPVQGAT